MTGSEMLTILQKATPEELTQDMTVYIVPGAMLAGDEFFPVTGVQVSGEQNDCPADGILDDGHLFLEIGG